LIKWLLDQSATLTGRWVSLRPVGHEDYLAIFRWRSSTDVNILNFHRPVATYEEFVGEIEKLLLCAGDVGTIVEVYDGEGLEVELVEAFRDTRAVR